ncbi:LysR family transcriptional regulator [Tardiphaga sp. 709]|uniref:LysR family transcriptional regulator n=1 Tax=Tardiphaga sp. 709 TaxID=3076039 RepID=UPI0028EE139F|nr:LysR family transcriptional regulator [Tardiphaga sp. 709]WNV11772.1 LysR family transcriptional regulator [Tardiphaga sp. 709]
MTCPFELIAQKHEATATMKTKRIEALWSHMHWLVVLADMGSFTAAAERLGVSKAAMSHRIGELEQAAGVSLVRRTTRTMRLTEAGQQLVDETRAHFSDLDRSFASVKDMAAAPRGLLRVTVPVALGRQRIAPLIPDFLRMHPAVRIELELSDHLSSLAKEGFDLAIRHVASVPDTHVAWRLSKTNSLLVATRGYLRRRGVPSIPHDLTGHDCLHYMRGNVVPIWTLEPRKGDGERITVEVAGSFAANNSEVLREAALGGIGIALLPDFSAQSYIEAGKLEVVLPDWRVAGAFGDQLFAIRPYSSHVPRTVRVFVEFLRNTMRNGFG